MSILRIIKCNFKDCKTECTEPKYGEGWMGWGWVNGRADDETGSETFGLCPEHLNKVFEFMTGGE